jgi:predicted aspartyl protease/Tfp pilus assembly protein PilF
MRISGLVTHRTASTTRYRCAELLAAIFVLLCSTVPVLAADDDVKGLLRKAERLTRRGSPAEAEKLLRQALVLEPASSETKIELAFSITKQRRLLEAYDQIMDVAEAEPDNPRALSVLGTTLLYGGRFREARQILYKAIMLDRGQHLAWAGFGMLDFYENNLGESLNNLREAVYRRPFEPDYLFALAQVSARAEQYRSAAENYSAFLRFSGLKDADRRERIKGLITFLRYLSDAGGLYASVGSDRTSVPFELIGDRPVINVRVNGRSEPLRFVLDTGSGISVMSEDTARRIGVRALTRGGTARGIGGDGKFDIVYGLLREVAIGEVRVRSVPIYLRKLHGESQTFDGYIGLSLISKFLTTIDYGANTFALSRDPDEQPKAAPLSMPLRLTSSGFLSGEVMLHGVEAPLNFIVDTGASISVISERVARNDVVSQFANREKMRVIGAAGIKDDVPTYVLPTIRFGEHTRRDIAAIALDLDLINEASGWEQSGILGGNFLKNYRLTFDFRNSKVNFAPIKPENQ